MSEIFRAEITTAGKKTVLCLKSDMETVLMPLFLVLMLFGGSGCSRPALREESQSLLTLPEKVTTKSDDSTACAYWKCSVTKKIYLQKYVKTEGGSYRTAGAYPLDGGIHAYPLDEIDQYHKEDSLVNLGDTGFDPCPYCGNTALVHCDRCQKSYCEKSSPEPDQSDSGTFPFFGSGSGVLSRCPWCGSEAMLSPGNWDVGGGG